MTPPALRADLSAAQLDVLELVRTGALPSYPPDAAPGTLRLALPPLGEEAALVAEVELVDLEGVPVVRLPLEHGPDGPMAWGAPTWLSPRSGRPFEDWHVGPEAVAQHTGVVLMSGPVDLDSAAAALRRSGARPLLLALVSLDGDLAPGALSTAYQLRTLLDSQPGTVAAVAPVPPSLSAAERATVVRRYARGRPVSEPAPAPAEASGEGGTVLFLTGLSGSGKSTLAREARNRLIEAGERVTLLDGDVVRRHLSAGLGFSAADRDTNIRRLGWVAAEIAHHGGVVVCCPIAPFEHTRQEVRRMVESRGGRFLLVHVSTPLSECERRDRKGLYARARRGEIADFTGISSPYEEPLSPDLRVDTTGRDVAELANDVLALLGAGARC